MKEPKPTYKKQGNISLFDNEETMEKLNAMGNPLDRLSKVIDFEMFRETLETALYKERLTDAGAKPYDYVLMFKVLVLQRMNNLSDARTEYQIRDRLSFREFLGLSGGGQGSKSSRVVGFARNAAGNTLTNLVYNMNRYGQIIRLGIN